MASSKLIQKGGNRPRVNVRAFKRHGMYRHTGTGEIVFSIDTDSFESGNQGDRYATFGPDGHIVDIVRSPTLCDRYLAQGDVFEELSGTVTLNAMGEANGG